MGNLFLCPFLTGAGLPPTVELPLAGGGGSGPSSVSGGANTGSEGVCVCVKLASYPGGHSLGERAWKEASV